jgi:SAM-dependent methyltransferase
MAYASEVPPSFDPAFYRTANPDLSFDSDAVAEAHYRAEGRGSGLVASPLAVREGLIDFLREAGAVLEIGPFCRPLLSGPQVDYLDVLDAEALRERGRRLGMDVSACPETITFVGDLAQVDRDYDVVVSSHAIEHQPDLVAHLVEVERILKPGGLFALIIPDKRFCFDHFLPASSIASVLQAHRDERSVHSLASVVEHGALVTHNDAARHWRGDHGDPTIGRAARIRAAVDRFERSEGDYLDVHAWQFTPDSFGEIVETLNELGLTRLEPIAVYDTPRDRMEFCALLQLRRPARRLPRQDHGQAITFLQTADPFRYYDVLAATAPTVIEYCRRHGLAYESYVGIRRGWWNWQATYNRIPMLADLLARGFEGWAIYLDADAYINDLDFDLPAYLAEHRDRPAIFATSGVTGEWWDVNAGVAMINFGHAEGRRLVAAWAEGFAAIPDAELQAADKWRHGDNDQDLLQAILREDEALGRAVLVEGMDFLNSRDATFIRQHLRAQTGDLSERVRAIAAEVHDIFAQDGVREAPFAAEAILDERGRHALLHPVRKVPRLVVAPVAAPRPDLAERAIAAWGAAGEGDGVPGFQRTFGEALSRGDVAAVAADLGALGQAELAQGLLGGARQHARAAKDPVFAYRRAQRTYDALLSLAEIGGALRFENPDNGRWAENSLIPAARLAAMIGEALGIAIDPPPQIGGYLGIAAGGSRVLHLRMIEALHSAWRARQLAPGDGARLIELGGGVGLTACYAHRLGVRDHAIVDAPVLHAVQAYVLGDLPAGAVSLASAAVLDGGADLLIVEDGFSALPVATARDLLARGRTAGIGRIFAVSQEAPTDGIAERPTMRALVAEVGGYALASRQRHALRPGYVEEIFDLR